MNLSEALKTVDLNDILDRLNAYAISRLKSVNIKSFDGKEPIDFVGDLLLKVLDGQRDWGKARCNFREFLFGCLRSEIDNFFRVKKYIVSDPPPEFPSFQVSTKIVEQRSHVTELLIKAGADDDEQTIFEYWMDGVIKPAEIAQDLGVDVKEIYTIVRRLERRLEKIKYKALRII
jgi:DNA-directed RNA polymerase specialized sigma24 family protein